MNLKALIGQRTTYYESTPSHAEENSLDLNDFIEQNLIQKHSQQSQSRNNKPQPPTAIRRQATNPGRTPK